MIIFSVELGLRIFVHCISWEYFSLFFTSTSNLIDLLALLPFYLELIFLGNHVTEFQRLSVIRLFRLLRLFKYYTYSSYLNLSVGVMKIAIKASKEALISLFIIFLSFLVINSTLLYFAERGTFDEESRRFLNINGEPSQFDSIPAAFWFVLSTMSTGGFANMVPLTAIGRIICFPMVLCGILFIALPSVIIGKNFTDAWDQLRTEGRYLMLYNEEDHQSPMLHSVQDIRLDSTDGEDKKTTSTNRLEEPITSISQTHLGDIQGISGTGYEKFVHRAGFMAEELLLEELYDQRNLDGKSITSNISTHFDDFTCPYGHYNNSPSTASTASNTQAHAKSGISKNYRLYLISQYLEESKRHHQELEKLLARLKYRVISDTRVVSDDNIGQ